MDYPIAILPLSEEDGGGFLSIAPDLMGCMSDGETQEEALENGRQAVAEWLETAKRRGLPIPEPFSRSKREREFREHLLAHLKDAAASMSDIEARIGELERAISDLQERQDHTDTWSRFAELSTLPTPYGAPPQQTTGNC